MQGDQKGGAPGAGIKDHEAQVDMVALRAYRLGRVRAALEERDLGGCVLFDPINVRYATGSRNMSIHCMHTPSRCAFVATDGPVILFEYRKSEHLAAGLESIDEIRPAISWNYFSSGGNREARAIRWADQIAEVVREHAGGNRRIGFDHLDPLGAELIKARGLEIVDGQEPLEHARAVKSAEEIACMEVSISVCEAGMARMREALRPGISENQLWALLHETNIAHGGEWIETRLLSSGPRTNPWMQECGERLIWAGELVAFDTDLVGPFGYFADISRTYFCGPGRPSPEQRRLYRVAWEQLEHNIAALKAGLSFREFSERGWPVPREFEESRYLSLAHGVGLADEYPVVAYAQDFGTTAGYDGVIEANMTLCLESYIGVPGGAEGVKLEEQVLVTEEGCRRLSTFPFEEELLA